MLNENICVSVEYIISKRQHFNICVLCNFLKAIGVCLENFISLVGDYIRLFIYLSCRCYVVVSIWSY